MNQQSGHLSDHQIRECADTVPGGSPEDVEAHLSQCESCLGRLLEWQRTQLRIGEADAMRPKPYADCPEENTLQEVAAEMASPEISTRVLQHASQCDHCGPLLKQYLEDFSDELSPEIEALIDQLPFSQPQWQREKAEEIVHSSTPVWKRVWNGTAEWVVATKVRAAAAAMATLVAAIGITRGPAIMNWVENRKANEEIRQANEEMKKAKNLVADAYVEKDKRLLEPRLTGVGYAPYQPRESTLGSGHPDDRPDLNNLVNELSRKFSSGDKYKLGSGWWQTKGRQLLLQSSNTLNTEEAKAYLKEARESFEEAQKRGVKDFSLEIDLAVTYFEEESLLGQPKFRKTIQGLTKVLDSTNPAPTPEEKKTALYNLALVYEKTKDWGFAVSAWENYLKADPTGAWADDARRHLDKDREKAPQHPPYLSPSDYNARSREPRIIRDVEQYQQIALERDWPAKSLEDPASEAGKAAASIARTLRLQHCDPMLTDLLAFPGKGEGPPAIRALSAVFIPIQNDQQKETIDCSRKIAGLFASRANFKDGPSATQALRPVSSPQNDEQKDAIDCPQKVAVALPAGGEGMKGRIFAIQALSTAFSYNKNDKPEAIGCSRKATDLFTHSGNVAGELLARFQEIYALQRELDADGCLEQLDKVWARTFATRYYWLQGQLALEKAICANMAFKSTTSDLSMKLSIDIATELHFPELSLRICGMQAGIARRNGELDEAWRRALDCLEEYWKDEYSAERYYQSYAVMRSIAADSGDLHTSKAYLQRSIDIFETTAPEDLALKFVLSASLANLLRQMGDEAAAEAEAKRTRNLIRSMQAGKPVAPAYLELPAIELADFELRRGEPGLALTTLKPIGDAPRTADKFVKLGFFHVRGDANLRLGKLEEAAEDYRQGIHVAQEFFKQPTNNEIKRLSWVKTTNKIYAGFVQILLKKGQSEKALKVWEWSKRQLLDRINTQLLDVATQADSLSLPRTAYPHIVYASFEDQLQIWLVKDGRVMGKSIALKQSRLLDQVQAFNANCRNKDPLESEVEKQEAELYKLLLQPILAELSPSGIVAIEFDDAVPPFAIEALKSPAGSYFDDDHLVLHSPGILAETLLRESAPLKQQDQFLVADASPETGREVLPGHELPVQAIKLAYRNRVLLEGHSLTPRDLDHYMPVSAALLVISHGVRGSEGMGLKLSPDWSLRAKNFTPEYVSRLRLAVLAACSSGDSENGLPDPDNLVRSLLASKVPNVIASRWDVDSQSTGQLFERFYTHLAEGETPAQALQQARHDFRKAHSERAHPYYWAGFYLTGKLPAAR